MHPRSTNNLADFYPYANLDLQHLPYHYQYTPIQDRDFITSYRQCRGKYLDSDKMAWTHLLNREEAITELHALVNTSVYSTGLLPPYEDSFRSETLLNLLLFERLENSRDKLHFKWLEIFRKKYEASKRIRASYNADLTPSTKSTAHIFCYVILSFLFSEIEDLKFLNAQLKLNDYLIAHHLAISNRKMLLMLGLSIRAELTYIEKLLSIHQLYISSDLLV